jgi:putative tricarboxylic transport membrane protein
MIALTPLWRGLLCLALGSAAAAAADIRLVAPSPPGSGWDQVAHAMQEVLGAGNPNTTITIENVPGGNGVVGLRRFATQSSDGDVLITGLTMLDAVLVKRGPAELDQLTPLARLCTEYFAVAVPTNSPLRTVEDLKVTLQTEPSRISWGGGPLGSIDHAGAALLANAIGMPPVALNYVAFLTTADAVAAAIDGKVGAIFLSTVELGAGLKDERLRVLAVAAPQRLGNSAVPTLKESGFDLEYGNWRGLVARAGASEAERRGLDAVVTEIVTSPVWADMVESKGWQPAYLDGPAFQAFLQAEKARIRAALTAAGFLKSNPG